jgi:hypothetical protein
VLDPWAACVGGGTEFRVYCILLMADVDAELLCVWSVCCGEQFAGEGIAFHVGLLTSKLFIEGTESISCPLSPCVGDRCQASCMLSGSPCLVSIVFSSFQVPSSAVLGDATQSAGFGNGRDGNVDSTVGFGMNRIFVCLISAGLGSHDSEQNINNACQPDAKSSWADEAR